MVSDVVCPWCFIGKRRLEKAIALRPEIPVAVRYRPYFLNPWVPRAGMSRAEYLTAKFGSVERYRANAERIVAAARDEGLVYNVDAITRQPNTLDCHRLIHWADEAGNAARMKQRLMDLYFTEGADLTDNEVLVAAAGDCGMDTDLIRRRLASDEDIGAVTADAEAARSAGVEACPVSSLAACSRCRARRRRRFSPRRSSALRRRARVKNSRRPRSARYDRDERHDSATRHRGVLRYRRNGCGRARRGNPHPKGLLRRGDGRLSRPHRHPQLESECDRRP
jgi:predicted DsbA family dithiol-disulfide isomerase